MKSGLAAIHIRPGHPDFLDLPWAVPLAAWSAHCGRLVEVQRGLSRHEVVFVGYDALVYALKELPEPFAVSAHAGRSRLSPTATP